jgi:cytochrome P450
MVSRATLLVVVVVVYIVAAVLVLVLVPLVLILSDAIRKEHDEVLAGGQKLDFETIERMEYLHTAVKETLRLRPPIILIWRKALVDFTYKSMMDACV